MNIEDTRVGVAEYVVEELGVETVELKWSQGAKCTGGEITVASLERALDLHTRLYRHPCDPQDPANQASLKSGGLQSSLNGTPGSAFWTRRNFSGRWTGSGNWGPRGSA